MSTRPLSTVTNEAASAEAAASPAKRAKSMPGSTVLTYDLVGEQNLAFQLKPDDTLYDLCDLVCTEYFATFRGIDNGVDEHMWKFYDTGSRKTYERPWDCWSCDPSTMHPISTLLDNGHGVGSVLQLEYDYGTTSEACLRLKSITEDPQLAQQCPKRYEMPALASFQPHTVPAGTPSLDEVFPSLSEKLFHGYSEPDALFFFQPGRKHHHAYASVGTDMGCLTLVWIPERMKTVEDLLYALDVGFTRPQTGMYEWESRIIFPPDLPIHDKNNRAVKRYEKLCRETSSDGPSAAFRLDSSYHHDAGHFFAKAFPRCNAAYMSKKASERGWITYKHGVLQLCRGLSETPKWSNAPDEFIAEKQFDPTPQSVMASMQKKFKSLQELFCAAEALWP